MDAKSVVMRSLDETGNKLLELCQIVGEEYFTTNASGGPAMDWHLAHLMTLEDWSVNRVILKQEPKFDRSFREAFKGGRPIRSEDLELLPAREELIDGFAQTRQQSLVVLNDFEIERWGEKTPVDCRFPNLGTVWENFANDNWWHLGQLSMLPAFAGTTLTLIKPRFFSTDLDEVKLITESKKS